MILNRLVEKRTEERVVIVSTKINFRLVRRPTQRSVILFACFAAAILQLLVDKVSPAAGRTVRLCIASVDPLKLSSQCVMCNRREFPLTVIDCTGITKVNDLIANPLSVQEATCLIYNCRRVSSPLVVLTLCALCSAAEARKTRSFR